MQWSKGTSKKKSIISRSLAGALCFSMVFQSVSMPVFAFQADKVQNESVIIGNDDQSQESVVLETQAGQAVETEQLKESETQSAQELQLEEVPVTEEKAIAFANESVQSGTLLDTVREQAKTDFNNGENAEAKSMDLDLSDVVFDGTKVIDYAAAEYGGADSPYLKAMNKLGQTSDGTVIMRFKTTQEGVIFGTGNSLDNDGSNMIYGVLPIGGKGWVRTYLRNLKGGGLRGNFNPGIDLMDGKWHTAAITFRTGEAENCYVVVDGGANIYTAAWWQPWKPGFNQGTTAFTKLQVGGGYTITDGASKNFNGNIDFITVIPNGYTVDQLKELTAAQDYDVIYSGGEGASGTAPATVKVSKGDTFKLLESPFTKTGYEFAGWSDGEKVYQPGADYRMPGKAVSFDAVWNEKVTTVLFDKSEVRVNKGVLETPVDYTGVLDKVKNLSEGTINVRFKTGEGTLMSLFSMSNGNENASHAHVYVNGSNVGYEVRNGGTNVNAGSASVKDMSVNQWHTLSYVFSSAGTKIYCDGVKVLDNAQKGFFGGVSNPNTVDIGKTARSGGANTYNFTGKINYLEVRSDVMTEAQILDLQKVTVREEKEIPLPDNAVKTPDQLLFYAGYDGSIWYRIPGMATTKNGVVLAAIDKRQNGGGDQGNIDTALRRSYDNGKTWTDSQVVLNLPAGQSQHALVIDPVVLHDEEIGRTFIFVDMFPESQAAMNTGILEKGSGYKKVGDKSYCILRDYEGKLDSEHKYTKTYTIREHGEVWLEGATEADAVPTDYSVPNFSTGALYKDGKPAGNIFIYTGSTAGELKIVRNMRIWCSYSDDDGETWSDGIDLTSMIKEDWMLFMGVGPGNGIQVKNGAHKGRLIVPVYVANQNWTSAQASTCMLSDDHGKTWKMADKSPLEASGIDLETMNNNGAILTESAILEMNDGTLFQFCRNSSGALKYSISEDSGNTWGAPIRDASVPEVYCQLTAVHYPEKVDGKEAIILANPNGSGRSNGTVRIGLYDPEKKTFEWKYNKLVHAGSYGYSSLTVLPNNDIGLFYEGGDPKTYFTSFNIEWIKAPEVIVGEEPVISNVKMKKTASGIDFTVDFDSYMIKTGSPVLKFSIDGTNKEAVYASGNASKQMVFRYTGAADIKNELVVLNVGTTASDSISDIGNAAGKLPKDGEFTFGSDGTAKCTCNVEEMKLSPEEILIPYKLDSSTVELKGAMKESTCAREGHEFAPVYTYTVVTPGATGAQIAGDKLTVTAAGEVKIKVEAELHGITGSAEFTLQVKKANPGEQVNIPPSAKIPMPEQKINSVKGVSFSAGDIAVDPDGDEMTITKIVSGPSSIVLAELRDGVITMVGSNAGTSRLMVNVSDGKGMATIEVPIVVTEEGAYDKSDYLSAHNYMDKASTVGYGSITIDKNPNGGTISLLNEKGEKVFFEKGYGAHCNSALIFNLPEDHTYTEFDTYFGVDASMPAVAAISFKVSVDGEKKYESESLQSTSQMGHTKVDITGAKVLKLEATFTNGTNGSGHSVWAGSKLLSTGSVQVDTTLLDACINGAKGFQAKDYSASTFAVLQKALKDAEAVAANPKEQITVFEQLKALQSAVKGLEHFVPAKEIILSVKTLKLAPGGSRRLFADLLGENGVESNDVVTWSTSNPAVATVSADGKVSAAGSGTAVITAAVSGGVKAECQISVDECTCVLGTPVFDNQNISIPYGQPGKTVDLNAQAALSGNCQAAGHEGQQVTYSYTIQTGSNIASVSGNKLTVTGEGTVTVRAAAQANGKQAVKDAQFTITKEPDTTVCTCVLQITEFNGQSIMIPYNAANKQIELKSNATLSGNCEKSGHKNSAITYSYQVTGGSSLVQSLNGNKLTVNGAGKVTVRVTAQANGKTSTKDADFMVTKENPPVICTCVLDVTEFNGQSVVIPYDAAKKEIELAAKAVLSGDCKEEGHKDAAITYSYEVVEGLSSVESLKGSKLSVKSAGRVVIRTTAQANGKTSTKHAVFTITKQPVPVYTVTLNAAGGRVSGTSKRVNAGAAYGSLPVPVRAGYVFQGWYNGNVLVKAADLCKGNVTLTAKWKLTAPGKVTGLKSSARTTSSVKLSWNKMEGASGYTVYRYDTKKKNWKAIKKTSATSYKDTKKNAGSSYRYRVLASNSVGKGMYSSVLTAVTQPVKPVISAKKSGRTLKLSWKKQSAEKIVIYAKTKKGNYSKIGTVSGKKTTFGKSKMKKNTTYQVRVRAYTKQGSGYVYSSYSSTATVKF